MGDEWMMDDGSDAPQAARVSAWQPRNSVALWVGVLHVMAAGWGVRKAINALEGAEGSALPIVVLAFVFPFVAIAACNADARRSGSPLPLALRCAMMMLGLVAIPVYLIQTRRWLGLAWTALWTTTLVMCTVTGAVSTFVLSWLTS
jgi:hypothetical protein